MQLRELQSQQNAQHASDGIPLQFGDIASEYHAAVNQSALFDRSHEGRITITGADRFEIMHRISTNDLYNLAPGEGRGTVFTKANARIIDRVMVYNRGDEAYLITEPGRGLAMTQFLQRQIFFNDDAALHEITAQTHQFTLHGATADNVMQALGIQTQGIAPQHGIETQIANCDVFVARRKPLVDNYWSISVFDGDSAGAVWQAICDAGKDAGLIPAGSLVYNMLRIQSGQPAYGREVSADYLPLEVGLWDEVSFTKGCYTGQEIIARMESRHQLARVAVRLQLETEVQAPANLLRDGKVIGRLTSSVSTPDGITHGIGVIKTNNAQPDTTLQTEAGIGAKIINLAGAAPPEQMLS